jgi:hypothetical protein
MTTATAVEVKETGMIFTGESIRAILNGKKTQTRRVIKPQPLESWMTNGTSASGNPVDWSRYYKTVRGQTRKNLWIMHPTENKEITCPHGGPGDRLWIREAFAHLADLKTKDPGTAALMSRAFFRADHPTGLSHDDATDLKWRSPLFLPRELCRITLQITNIRVERIRDINEADAIAEGVRQLRDGSGTYAGREGPGNLVTPWPTAKEAFADLWDSINAKRGFSRDSNPWVWVISFRKIG